MKKLNTHDPVLRQAATALATCLAACLVILLLLSLQATGAKAGPNDIGLVLDPGGPNDHGYNEMSVQGLQRAESELGVERDGLQYSPVRATTRRPSTLRSGRQRPMLRSGLGPA